jgi:hypothetical protein
MGKVYPEINPDIAAWIRQQHLYFVASAPLAGDGLVNCSPKGLDSFVILDPHTVAYLDLTGSGVETIAHLRENGRIVIMFCALDGSPKIVRLHGIGTAIEPTMPEFAQLRAHFPDNAVGVRSIIHIDVGRVSDSCGFGVPVYEYVSERDTLVKWAVSKGEAGVAQYHAEKNQQSLDGLPALQAIKTTEK